MSWAQSSLSPPTQRPTMPSYWPFVSMAQSHLLPVYSARPVPIEQLYASWRPPKRFSSYHNASVLEFRGNLSKL